MFISFDSAAQYVTEFGIRMIDLKFIDLYGRWHHVTITSSEFTPNLMKEGVGFDGSSVGLKSVKSGDMALIPDMSTGFPDPFSEVPTLSFICDTVEADTKEVFNFDPRQIAKKAEQILVQSGVADRSVWGPEFEFYLLNSAYFRNSINEVSYRLESDEACWNNKINSHEGIIPQHGGYHTIPPKDKHYNLRSKIVTALEIAGVLVKYHHHEVGSPGQSEIETPMLEFIQAADTCMMVKYFVKMVAAENDLIATFLPKPFYGEAGSGMHFHQQIFKGKNNVFYDSEANNLLSKTALYYIGGLLKHAPAVMAFTNPSTNSYRRLVPGFEAPVNSFFSSGNRSAAIRIPKYATQPDRVRFEFRPPDATCNPYLAMSAMLLAGIDGIENKIDPTKEGFGPIDEDIYTWSATKRSQIRSLPTSLEDSLQALSEDQEFLLKKEVFAEELISSWIKTKQSEAAELKTRPHPYEVEMYFDF